MQLGRWHFGYNAVEDKSRRQSPKTRVKHESKILTPTKRSKLLATTQDQLRNHSLVAWMVRKHLDYVSKFHVSFRTGRDDLDAVVNQIFKWHGAPRNFDYLGRFGRDEMFRLYELEKVSTGDAGLLKLNNLKLQAIESDLIAKGTGSPEDVNGSGLVLDTDGRVRKYAICTRGSTLNKVDFHHLEPVDKLIFDGYWSRFSSQYRGVSPLSTAINAIQDISEAFEFNLVKAKMHALFGIAIMRDTPETGDFGKPAGATAETADATATSTGTELDLNPRGINILDLNSTDKVDILESSSPSTEFVNGSYLFIQVAMLALDIPITCFDSRRSSFSGRIADLNEYEVSNDWKQKKNRYVRKEYSDWLLEQIWNNPASQWQLRTTAEANGFSLLNVQEALEWIPSGAPWLDKLKQIQGDKLAIEIGLDNSIDAARRRGGNVFTNIDKQAQVIAYAEKNNVPLSMGTNNDKSMTDGAEDEDDEPETDEQGAANE